MSGTLAWIGQKHINSRDAADACSEKEKKRTTVLLTVLLSLIRAVAAVIDRVTQLVAVDAAVVVTAETERSLALDFHCG